MVFAMCRYIILGTDYETLAPDAPKDFYLLAGGRFCTNRQRSPSEIDLEYYWRGAALPCTYLAIYRGVGDRLTLCPAESGQPRPTAFDTSQNAYWSLTEYVREANA
jgi:hypothetical protein